MRTLTGIISRLQMVDDDLLSWLGESDYVERGGGLDIVELEMARQRLVEVISILEELEDG